MGFNEAAARCRGKHWLALPPAVVNLSASMRPRPDAAENSRVVSQTFDGGISFNEAAARCRGKHALLQPGLAAGLELQ